MEDPMVVGFSASPRKGGNSVALLNACLEGAQCGGARTLAYDLAAMNIRACTGCEKCRGKGICKGLKDDMGGLYEILEKAQGLLLVSPTHHYNVSVSMKAFIDRLYPFYDFSDQRPGPWSSRLANRGKKAALATVCEQISTYDMGFVMEAMERPLLALGYEVIGKLPAMGIFEAGGVLERKDIMRAAHEMGNDLVKSIPA